MTFTVGIAFIWLVSTFYWGFGGNPKLATYCGFVATACMAVLLQGAARGLFLR